MGSHQAVADRTKHMITLEFPNGLAYNYSWERSKHTMTIKTRNSIVLAMVLGASSVWAQPVAESLSAKP